MGTTLFQGQWYGTTGGSSAACGSPCSMADRMRVTSFIDGTAFELSVEFARVYRVSWATATGGSSGATRASGELFGLPLNPPAGNYQVRGVPRWPRCGAGRVRRACGSRGQSGTSRPGPIPRRGAQTGHRTFLLAFPLARAKYLPLW